MSMKSHVAFLFVFLMKTALASSQISLIPEVGWFNIENNYRSLWVKVYIKNDGDSAIRVATGVSPSIILGRTKNVEVINYEFSFDNIETGERIIPSVSALDIVLLQPGEVAELETYHAVFPSLNKMPDSWIVEYVIGNEFGTHFDIWIGRSTVEFTRKIPDQIPNQ